MELAIKEVSFIISTIEFKSALARFLTLMKLSRIFDLIIIPALHAVPVLLIVEPFSIIHASFGVDEDAYAVGFAVTPVAPVDVAV